jgi:hypothetical protein
MWPKTNRDEACAEVAGATEPAACAGAASAAEPAARLNDMAETSAIFDRRIRCVFLAVVIDTALLLMSDVNGLFAQPPTT